MHDASHDLIARRDLLVSTFLSYFFVHLSLVLIFSAGVDYMSCFLFHLVRWLL